MRLAEGEELGSNLLQVLQRRPTELVGLGWVAGAPPVLPPDRRPRNGHSALEATVSSQNPGWLKGDQQQTSSKVIPRAFGVVVGHSPSTILSLPALVSRSPPDNSCMYPSWISRSLCSTGIARCIKPLAQARNETNSSWVNGGGAGAIPRICVSFSSGRLISSNVATWVLSNQDCNTAPQTPQDARPVCGIKNFTSVHSYSAPQLHLTIVAILGICARNRPFSSA